MEHRRTFVLSNDVDAVPEARLYVERELAALNLQLSPRRAGAVALALTEALSNILRHAVPPEERSVEMGFAFDGGSFTVDFAYRGAIFDPNAISQPDFTGESDGGFGYFIIANLTDEVHYEMGDHGRHRVRLRWIYPEPEAEAA